MTSVPFRLIPEQRLDRLMPAWTDRYPRYDTVVGYSDLGHAFLMSTRTGEYGILDPYSPGVKDYGVFTELTDFVSQVLFAPDVITYVLQPQHVTEIRRHLGPLAENEVYIATPYPFLGGSETPDAYQKGGVWTFFDLVAQEHDFE
ncbi:T6SS immunity protein Tdi1 domain-containing protein [Nocardia sp. CDC153]|uniref:T6SS immunity protein Tdi1 domain-containing protein n=1 Tax=Nocardia sp. CDC153 TaxID=3112167 RepID=UPI002DB56FEB|nr:T6SS immunity protein Tdi1 domain-containing protein [Nocardia sp. CDC153]MEC3952665.1 T6SS immunity protein Tdi1 domain-containing protein [Nocardia sp. CDC153]